MDWRRINQTAPGRSHPATSFSAPPLGASSAPPGGPPRPPRPRRRPRHRRRRICPRIRRRGRRDDPLGAAATMTSPRTGLNALSFAPGTSRKQPDTGPGSSSAGSGRRGRQLRRRHETLIHGRRPPSGPPLPLRHLRGALPPPHRSETGAVTADAADLCPGGKDARSGRSASLDPPHPHPPPTPHPPPHQTNPTKHPHHRGGGRGGGGGGGGGWGVGGVGGVVGGAVVGGVWGWGGGGGVGGVWGWGVGGAPPQSARNSRTSPTPDSRSTTFAGAASRTPSRPRRTDQIAILRWSPNGTPRPATRLETPLPRSARGGVILNRTTNGCGRAPVKKRSTESEKNRVRACSYSDGRGRVSHSNPDRLAPLPAGPGFYACQHAPGRSAHGSRGRRRRPSRACR